VRDLQWRVAEIVSPTGRGAPRSPARGNSSARPLPPRPLTTNPRLISITPSAPCVDKAIGSRGDPPPTAPALAPQQEQLASGHFFTGKERGAEWFRCCISGGSSFAPKASERRYAFVQGCLRTRRDSDRFLHGTSRGRQGFASRGSAFHPLRQSREWTPGGAVVECCAV
jgi:hypothetical protein